jgi:hypothetical protein
MANRVRTINLMDFTGGLNVRADAFQLAENESPYMLNMEVDPRGGFYSRKGWEIWNTNALPANWNPRNAHILELDNGTEIPMIANDSEILVGPSGVFAVLSNGSTDVVATADPHGADFASWGPKVYVACGRTNVSYRWAGVGNAVAMTAAATATWVDDYTTPALGVMPKADLICAHAGYMFVASTNENSTDYVNRIRWSHPNDPEDWASEDYLDINEGGGPITAIESFNDHLLIFKKSSVWALYGYDADSWQLVNVSRSLGAPHRQAVARSEQAVYFYSNPHGVHEVTSGAVKEISEQLRPIFASSDFNTTAADNVWLGWVNRRLWFSGPYDITTAASDAVTVFVFDPTISDRGAWMMFRGADESGLGPFVEGGHASGNSMFLACARTTDAVVLLEAIDESNDELVADAPQAFLTEFTTRWMDGGWPTLKKSWRRPDFVAKERTLAYTLNVEVFHDYDDARSKRSGEVLVDTEGGGVVWGDGTLWGATDAVWGSAPTGSRIERGSALGSARAVQLRFTGEDSKPWGIDGIVFKFIPRRIR